MSDQPGAVADRGRPLQRASRGVRLRGAAAAAAAAAVALAAAPLTIGQPNLLEAAAFLLTGRVANSFDRPGPSSLAGRAGASEWVVVRKSDPADCIVDVYGSGDASGRYRFSNLRGVSLHSKSDDVAGVETHEIALEGPRIKCALSGTPDHPQEGECADSARLGIPTADQAQARMQALTVVHEKFCVVRRV